MQIPIFKDAAAGDDSPVRLAHVFNGTFTLNDPTDDPDDTYQIEDIAVDVVWDQAVEPLPERDGMQGYQPRRAQAIYRIRGWVKAPNIAALYDKIAALEAAFDPVLAYENDTSAFDRGFLPYAFSVPTADTANYATGLIPLRVYVQTIRKIVPIQTTFDGYQARFELVLRAMDPRAYLQTQSEESRTGPGDIVVDNSLATYPSWPILVFDGNGTSPTGDIVVTRTDPTSSDTITIDGSGGWTSTSMILTLDTQARSAVNDSGTNRIQFVKPTSQYFQIMPESNTVNVTGVPANMEVTVRWVRAFV